MKDIASNKKAYFEYEILDKHEAGLELLGTEVKSARSGQVSLSDSYVTVHNKELYLINAFFAPYKYSKAEIDSRRSRKILMHKKEIVKLIAKIKEKGLTIVPTKMYFKHNVLKVEIAVGKGKRQFEKRETIKKRESEREIRRKIGKQ